MEHRLIDADELRVLFTKEFKQTKQLIVEGETHLDTLAEGYAEAWHIVKYRALSVDAVPVVRCRECRKMKTYECPMYFANGEDDFCSFGERRDDDRC